MNKALGALLLVVLLGASVAAGGHHHDEIEQARADLDQARTAAQSQMRSIALGALWGVGIGTLAGSFATLVFLRDGGAP